MPGVPSTVSPELWPLMAAPLPPWNVHLQSIAEWQACRDQFTAPTLAELPRIQQQLGVTLDHAVMGGVKINIVTPQHAPRQEYSHFGQGTRAAFRRL